LTKQRDDEAAPARPEPQFLSDKEVSARYSGKISVRTLANWRNLGTGPAYTKAGGRVLYPIEKLVEWEQRNTVNSTSEYSRGGKAA
jgi:hypothetical protein